MKRTVSGAYIKKAVKRYVFCNVQKVLRKEVFVSGVLICAAVFCIVSLLTQRPLLLVCVCCCRINPGARLGKNVDLLVHPHSSSSSSSSPSCSHSLLYNVPHPLPSTGLHPSYRTPHTYTKHTHTHTHTAISFQIYLNCVMFLKELAREASVNARSHNHRTIGKGDVDATLKQTLQRYKG